MWKFTQRSWVGGQLDKELMGRQDLAKYFQGASKILNFLVRRQGNVSKRRGTDLTCDLANLLGRDKNGNDIPVRNIRMIPVERDDDGQYLLLSGGKCFRAKKNKGIYLANGTWSKKINPYDAQDSEGNMLIYSGEDALHNDEKPVCIKRYDSSTKTYTRIWYGTLRDAFISIQSGDTVELHNDIVVTDDDKINSSQLIPAVGFTWDLNGYCVYVRCQSSAVIYQQATISSSKNVTIKITSSRSGAKVRLGYRGNQYFWNSQREVATGDPLRGTFIIDGNIEFINDIATSTDYGTGDGFFNISGFERVEVRSGRFVIPYVDDTTAADGYFFLLHGSPMYIYGGEFICDATLIKNSISFIRNYPSERLHLSRGSINVYGGVFKLYDGVTDFGNKEPTVLGCYDAWYGYPRDIYIHGGKFNVGDGCLLGGGFYSQEHGNMIYAGSFSSQIITHAGDTLDSMIKPYANNTKNDVYPDAHGMYGIKQVGAEDYWYDGTLVGDSRPYFVGIPYDDDSLGSLSIKQSGDTIFIAHRNYKPAKISISGNGKPSFSYLSIDSGSLIAPPVIESATMSGNDDSDGAERTVMYCATAIRDGAESRISNIVKVTYHLPWSQNAVVNIVLSKGNTEDYDYFNIYKDDGNGFALIGSTENLSTYVDATSGTFNDGSLFTFPTGSIKAVNVEDFTQSSGLGTGGFAKLIMAPGRELYPHGIGGDEAAISTSASGSTIGIKIKFKHAMSITRMRLILDARITDRESGYRYVAPCCSAIGVKITGSATRTVHSGGGLQPSVTFDETSVLRYTSPTSSTPSWNPQKLNSDGSLSPISFSMTNGYFFPDWNVIPRSRIQMPDSTYIQAFRIDQGEDATYFNDHRRACDVLLNIWSETVEGESFLREYDTISITEITILFSDYAWADFGAHVQGIVRGIEFYSGSNLVGSAGTHNFQDDYISPDHTVTPNEDITVPHFSGVDDHPGCVAVYGEKAQRLVFASTSNNPLGFWMSRVGDLYDFTTHKSIREDDAIEASIAATELPNINHALINRNLLFLTDGSEWKIAPVSGNTISYKTVCASKESSIGSNKNVHPITVGDEVIFAAHYADRLIATKYSVMSEGYETRDLSVLSQNIFADNPIVSMDYMKNPDSTIICVLRDGTIGALVYMKEHEVIAWSHCVLGGGMFARQVSCNHGTINGTSDTAILAEQDGRYLLLAVRDELATSAIADRVCMDSVREISGDGTMVPDGMTAVNKVTGKVLHAGEEMTSGNVFILGYVFDAEVVSVRPEPQGNETVQFEIKNAKNVEIRSLDGGELSVAPFGLIDSEYVQTVGKTPAVENGVIELGHKDLHKNLTGSNNGDGRIHIRSRSPYPQSILSVSTNYEIQPLSGVE